ncbi:MAG: nitroreductase family protein [Verrucomicrobiota bacterium]|mgnify:CR=1 FL=1
MDLFETIQARQSVRAYQTAKVEPAKLEAILAAANQAPSAGNLQAYQIHVVRDKKTKQALAKAALDQAFVAQAPVVLVFCADPARSAARYGARGEGLYCVQDATIAAAYAQLAATALGLATCWVGAFDEEPVARAMHLLPGQRPIGIFTLGYPAESPPRAPRRSLAELVSDKGG